MNFLSFLQLPICLIEKLCRLSRGGWIPAWEHRVQLCQAVLIFVGTTVPCRLIPWSILKKDNTFREGRRVNSANNRAKIKRANQGKSARGSYFFLLGPIFYLCDFYRLAYSWTLTANGPHSSKNVRDLKYKIVKSFFSVLIFKTQSYTRFDYIFYKNYVFRCTLILGFTIIDNLSTSHALK